MSNLLKRLLTALVFGGIGISSMLISHWTFLLLVLIINSLTLFEYYTLTQSKFSYVKPVFNHARVLGILLGNLVFVICGLVALGLIDIQYLLFLPCLLFLILLFEISPGSSSPITNISIQLLAQVYITIPFGLVPFIVFSGENYNWPLLLGILCLLWANDIFAYFTGSLFGKHKLLERISPKKTIEGFVGGGVASVLLSLFISTLIETLSMTEWIVAACIMIVFGTLGDLAESMLKRSLQIKDSGNILPGHGGLLDRFDGLLFSLPFIAAYLFIK